MSANQYSNFKKDLKAAEEAGATYEQINALWRYANQDKWEKFYDLLNQIAEGVQK